MNCISFQYKRPSVLLFLILWIFNHALWAQVHVQVIKKHKDIVNSISLSSDLQFFASASSDKKVCIFSYPKGLLKTCLTGHKFEVWCVDILASKGLIASAGRDASIKIWNMHTNQCIKTIANAHANDIYSLVFTHNGKYLLSAGWDKKIKIWRVGDWKLIKDFQAHQSPVLSLDISPNDSLFLSTSSDKTIKVWQMADASLIKTLKGHDKDIYSAVFSPDGKKIASGSVDFSIKIWDIESTNCLRTLIGHNLGISALAFSSDGRFIFSGSWDTTIKIWLTETGENIYTIEGHSDCVNSICFDSKDSTIISGSYDNTIRIWNMGFVLKNYQTGLARKNLKAHLASVTGVRFMKNHKAVSSSGDSAWIVWDTDLGEVESCYKVHQGQINGIERFADSLHVLTYSRDGLLMVMNMEGQIRDTLRGHTDWVQTASISKNDSFIISGSWDKRLILWNALNGKEIKSEEAHHDWIPSVRFHPSNQFAVSCSGDSTIKFWKIPDLVCYKTIRLDSTIAKVLSFSPDGDFLAYGCSNGKVFLYDIAADSTKVIKAHKWDINAIVFSPDGRYFATSSTDNVIKIWDRKSLEKKLIFSGHFGQILSLDFHANGKMLISGSGDKSVKIWRIYE